jgi:protein tyrosine/serine phosphatase
LADRTGFISALPLMTKDDLADQILDRLLVLKNQR